VPAPRKDAISDTPPLDAPSGSLTLVEGATVDEVVIPEDTLDTDTFLKDVNEQEHSIPPGVYLHQSPHAHNMHTLMTFDRHASFY
jgi:hypothetical protein